MIQPTADLTFLTEDHPQACGREAAIGDLCYNLYFTTENQKIICIQMGEAGYKGFKSLIRQLAVDDEIDAALGKDS